jgi:biopolymer transport protein ExbB
LITLGAEELSDHAEESELAKHLTLLVDISKDLTFDGWVVIVLCALLAVVGMVIAVGKFLYLNAMDKSSKEFLRRWESISSDLTALDSDSDASIQSMGGTLTGKSLRLMKQSPLYRIYHLGSSEIAKRVQASTAEKGAEIATTKRGLSGRSIQAIKATMHGGLMREVERLNSNLVFLTIGIAGGPYLGLLGTVIGVMITFAVIAKSGQVEVNSIAPGIAGALLATVAGLAVAIPCLFVYSYLSTRIKTAVSSMETFIDEFIAKMAEHHKES